MELNELRKMQDYPRVMMVSRYANSCGIAQYGIRVANILSKEFNVFHLRTNQPEQFSHMHRMWKPDVILYNYYAPILPWITDEFLADKRRYTKHILLHHELWRNFSPNLIVDINSSGESKPEEGYYCSPRPLFEDFEFEPAIPNTIPTIGTFGFGFGDKNFEGLTEIVCRQFKSAKIRMHIGYAEFGDSEGQQAAERIRNCKEIIRNINPGIILENTHHFMEDSELLNWLHQNDLNFFYYPPNEDRGLSSVIDYALSARKPLAISSSNQFKHILKDAPSIIVPDNDLPGIIARGIEPLKPLYEKFSNERLLEVYRSILI
jgi:hypothetical protein